MASLPISLTFFGIGGLGLRPISRKKRVVELSLFFVPIRSLIAVLSIDLILIFLNRQLVFFWILGIDFPSLGG